MKLDSNATIISATSQSTNANSALVLITVLTAQGGSHLLTEMLSLRLNTSVAEQQLALSGAVTRFGMYVRIIIVYMGIKNDAALIIIMRWSHHIRMTTLSELTVTLCMYSHQT